MSHLAAAVGANQIAQQEKEYKEWKEEKRKGVWLSPHHRQVIKEVNAYHETVSGLREPLSWHVLYTSDGELVMTADLPSKKRVISLPTTSPGTYVIRIDKGMTSVTTLQESSEERLSSMTPVDTSTEP